MILLCKILIVPLSFMGKLVNQESTLCNKTLQRVPFATYFGITPHGRTAPRLSDSDTPRRLGENSSQC
ncbi:hypothetical protein, partial [Scytonema sp. PCC 10023]|uniref:hypothetical protein n=1 Tax=Scytonema sp. PCC 10023 TaxID=1680591 RepID=UPI0039C62D85